MFEKYYFDKLKTIEDYRANGYKKGKVDRTKVKICFLDDKGYNVSNFKKTGYIDVDFKTKYKNPNDFAAYDIIACDIDGVGVDIDPKKQGLAVAEILKKKYPDKIVLIYSANNPYEYGKKDDIDGYFAKNLSPAQIASEFDEKAEPLFDKIAAWKTFEKNLKDANIPNKTIAYIEDAYVRSLESNTNLFRSEKKNDLMKSLLSTINTVIGALDIIFKVM